MSWRKYDTVLFIILLLTGNPMWGQDMHFSQFYASPVTLNPAMTGFMQGCYRANAIHRSQWYQLVHPYTTTAASVEAKVLQGRLFGDDFMGVGGVFYNDRSGGGALSENSFQLSGSYHNALSRSHRIGFGIQTGFVNRQLDYNNLIFPRQLQENSIDPDKIDAGERFGETLNYWDLQAGFMWTGTFSTDLSMFAGGAVYHLSRPSQSFTGQESILPMRYVVHGGSRIKGRKYLSFTPNFIGMYQANVRELNIGASVGYNYPNNRLPEAVFSVGSWFRYSDNADALIFVAGVEYQQFKVGASYDITVSSLQGSTSSTFVSALELSLSYVIKCQSQSHTSRHPCPRF